MPVFITTDLPKRTDEQRKLSYIANRKPKRVRALSYKPKCTVYKGAAAQALIESVSVPDTPVSKPVLDLLTPAERRQYDAGLLPKGTLDALAELAAEGYAGALNAAAKGE